MEFITQNEFDFIESIELFEDAKTLAIIAYIKEIVTGKDTAQNEAGKWVIVCICELNKTEDQNEREVINFKNMFDNLSTEYLRENFTTIKYENYTFRTKNTTDHILEYHETKNNLGTIVKIHSQLGGCGQIIFEGPIEKTKKLLESWS